MAMSKISKYFAVLPPSLCEKPPIPFVSKVKKIEKVDRPDADKSEWIKFDFL
jgi:hypothetical protein